MNTTEPIPLNMLLGNQKFLEQVFLKALIHARRHLRSSRVGRLKSMVNAMSLPLDGFSRSPFRIITTARVNELAQKLARATQQPDEERIFDCILPLWVEANPELEASTREVCTEQGIIPEPEPVTMVCAAPHPDVITRLIAAVRHRHVDIDEDSIRLMVVTITGLHDNLEMESEPEELDTMPHLPTPPPNQSLDTSNLSPAWWSALLDWLRHVPYESALWETEAVELFRDHFAELAQEKQQLRSGRASIAEAIVRLRADFTDTIADLELNTIFSWDAVHCPAHAIPHVLQQLEQLQAVMCAWRDQDQMPRKRSERAIYLEELQRLEEQIEILHASLHANLVDASTGKETAQREMGGEEDDEEGPEQQDARPVVAVSDPVPTPPDSPSATVSIDDAEDFASAEVVEEIATTPAHENGAQATSASQVFVASSAALEDETDELAAESLEEVRTVIPELHEDEADSVRPDPSNGVDAPHQPPTSNQPDVVVDQLSVEQLAAQDQPQAEAEQGAVEEGWQELFSSLLEADDITGAYWLARALAARDITPPIALDLLQVLGGSRWLPIESGHGGALAADIATIASRYQPSGRDEEVLLGLGAACIPVLRTPESGLLHWVEAPATYHSLYELARTIREFASQGLLIRDEELSGLTAQNRMSSAIAEAVAQTQRWMEEAPGRRTTYARASKVWQTLVSRGELYNLATIICANQNEQAGEVRQRLRQWRNRTYVVEQIRTIDRALSKSGATLIDGEPREQLIRDVGEACTIFEKWCDQVERNQQLTGRDDAWLLSQIMRLRSSIEELLPDVEHTLTRRQTESVSPSYRAATRYLHRRLGDLGTMLGLKLLQTPPVDPLVQRWNSLEASTAVVGQMGYGLQQLLGRRLWALPGVEIDQDGQATEEGLRQLPEHVRVNTLNAPDTEEIIAAWRTFGDFRWVEMLLAFVEDAARNAEIHRETQDALTSAVANLKRRIDDVRRPLEMAVFAGDLNDDTRSRLEGMIERIDPLQTRNFAQARRILGQVEAEIAHEHELRINELGMRWNQRRLELAARLSDSNDVARITQEVETALERRNTWEINEVLARVDRIIQGSVDHHLLSAGEELSGEALKLTQHHFLQQQGAIEEALKTNFPSIIAAIRQRETVAGIAFTHRHDHTSKVLETWYQLQQHGAQLSSSGGFNSMLKEILEFLGFEKVAIKLDDNQQILRRELRTPHVTMELPTGRGRPLPQIGGSPARQYDVLVLWNRNESLRTQLQRVKLLGSQLLILIYLGPLTSTQRRDIARLSRERPIVVLDEVILLMLAAEQERDTRFRIWLQCGLPYTTVNPYVPNAAGNVPAEIFYGRYEEVRDLVEPNGSCLVYGGRQLGKSALLTAVRRQFHHPERQHYAWIENIDLVGDHEVNQPATMLWEKIRTIFRDHLGIIRPFRPERPEEIAREVSRYMQRNAEARVLLLFDEADDFLDDDAEGRFQTVVALRQLMQETNRRFKVVFTGLHDVQRFAAIPNQPLAHFGKPICIGPLPPAPAHDLITQPIEALGYRFEHESLVLRILSYTNYHAGLIQIFCYELLKQLQRGSQASGPPFLISQRDVDNVYLAVRSSIRSRFELTLNLDARYRAIALALIVDQFNAADGFAQAYQPSTILSHTQAWWPAGFKDTTTDAVQGLLDEMCGLGILIRTIDGGYRLRSPNLVRLLGSTTEIGNALDQLSRSQPANRAERDTFHMPIGSSGTNHFSPLTYAQERTLHQATTPIRIIFGSELNCLSLLPTALEQFAPGDPSSRQTRVLRVSTTATQRIAFLKWIQSEIERNSQYESLIFSCQPMSSEASELAALVRDALSLNTNKRPQRPLVKVVFLFGTAQTAAWMRTAPEERHDLERQLTLLPLHRWTMAALQKRLQLRELNSAEAHLQEIFQTTGNWQLLLDAYFDRVAQMGDMRLAAEQLTAEVRAASGQLSIRSHLNTELASAPDLKTVLKSISENATGCVGMLDLLEYLSVEAMEEERGEAAVMALERLGLLSRREEEVVLAPLVNLLLGGRDD